MSRLIGIRCKCSNVFSQDVLINRILKQNLVLELSYPSGFESPKMTFNFGVYTVIAPRYSIPNITVKCHKGENT